MNSSYKEEHEQFVSGHEGTTFQETSTVFITTAAVCLLRDCLAFCLFDPSSSKEKAGNLNKTLRSKSTTSFMISGWFAIDFLLLVIPSLLNVTWLSDHVTFNLLAVLFINVLTFLYLFPRGGNTVPFSTVINNTNIGERKVFVTNFRSLVNLLTAICILAVDFKIFPRRFAKAETYGYGIMDGGVGFFVVSNAIVSSEARNKASLLPWRQQLKKAVLSTLPLMVLGVARLLSVKSVDYHEHVSEYGVHWNFFFTLAAVKILSSVMLLLLPGSNLLMVGGAITALHQVTLSQGLTNYVLNGVDGQGGRQGLVNANREGIVSLPGYLAIYLVGVQLGKFIFSKRDNIKEWLEAVLHLTAFIFLGTLLLYASNCLVQPVSRRFANTSYVCCVIGQSCLVLLVTLICEICKTALNFVRCHQSSPRDDPNSKPDDSSSSSQGKKSSGDATLQASEALIGRRNLRKGFGSSARNVQALRDTASDAACHASLLEAIGFNALLFFLLANLMTGLVNMSVSTIHASHTTAVCILLGYLVTLCLTVSVLHAKGVTTKIW